MSCTCMLGYRKILVKDEYIQMIKICNDATYKIKSWNASYFVIYYANILDKYVNMQGIYANIRLG